MEIFQSHSAFLAISVPLGCCYVAGKYNSISFDTLMNHRDRVEKGTYFMKFFLAVPTEVYVYLLNGPG